MASGLQPRATRTVLHQEIEFYLAFMSPAGNRRKTLLSEYETAGHANPSQKLRLTSAAPSSARVPTCRRAFATPEDTEVPKFVCTTTSGSLS